MVTAAPLTPQTATSEMMIRLMSANILTVCIGRMNVLLRETKFETRSQAARCSSSSTGAVSSASSLKPGSDAPDRSAAMRPPKHTTAPRPRHTSAIVTSPTLVGDRVSRLRRR